MDSNNDKHIINADDVIRHRPKSRQPQVDGNKRLNDILYTGPALDIIEDKINWLGNLVASGDDMIERFSQAVEIFKKELRESEKIPQKLASRFTSYNYQWGSNQQGFVDDLKRELNLCRAEKFHGARDTLQTGISKNPVLVDALQILRESNMNK